MLAEFSTQVRKRFHNPTSTGNLIELPVEGVEDAMLGGVAGGVIGDGDEVSGVVP